MTAALALVPKPSRAPVAEPPADDLWLMIVAWNSASDTQRAVAMRMADDNYLASKKDADNGKR